jgi:formate-dependent nitrite reductase cytochrome c552 subunit
MTSSIKKCFYCNARETKARRLVLFQGYVADSLEYIGEWVCTACYLTHENDLALLKSIYKVKIQHIEREIEQLEKSISKSKRQLKQAKKQGG